MGYLVGNITSAPDLPDGVPDAAAVIRAAIEPSADAWNREMAAMIAGKNLKFCEIGVVGDTSCRNSNHDGRIVTIETRAVDTEAHGGVFVEPCGGSIACVGGHDQNSVHLPDLTMTFEEPARECVDPMTYACQVDHVRFYWTDKSDQHGKSVDVPRGDPPIRFAHIGRTMLHEFGHTLGLHDFYDDKDFYDRPERIDLIAIMGTGKAIHPEDIAQLKAIYLLHDSADH